MREDVTDEEIKAALLTGLDAYDTSSFTDLFRDKDYCDGVFKITRQPGRVDIYVSRMYTHLPLGYKQLHAIATVFKTSQVDEVSRDFLEGCETCDYGSAYSWTLRVIP